MLPIASHDTVSRAQCGAVPLSRPVLSFKSSPRCTAWVLRRRLQMRLVGREIGSARGARQSEHRRAGWISRRSSTGVDLDWVPLDPTRLLIPITITITITERSKIRVITTTNLQPLPECAPFTGTFAAACKHTPCVSCCLLSRALAAGPTPCAPSITRFYPKKAQLRRSSDHPCSSTTRAIPPSLLQGIQRSGRRLRRFSVRPASLLRVADIAPAVPPTPSAPRPPAL